MSVMHATRCVQCVCSVSQKRVLDPLALKCCESPNVSGGTGTQGLCKNSVCSYIILSIFCFCFSSPLSFPTPTPSCRPLSSLQTLIPSLSNSFPSYSPTLISQIYTHIQACAQYTHTCIHIHKHVHTDAHSHTQACSHIHTQTAHAQTCTHTHAQTQTHNTHIRLTLMEFVMTHETHDLSSWVPRFPCLSPVLFWCWLHILVSCLLLGCGMKLPSLAPGCPYCFPWSLRLGGIFPVSVTMV